MEWNQLKKLPRQHIFILRRKKGLLFRIGCHIDVGAHLVAATSPGRAELPLRQISWRRSNAALPYIVVS